MSITTTTLSCSCRYFFLSRVQFLGSESFPSSTLDSAFP